jgi:hypothetical protein
VEEYIAGWHLWANLELAKTYLALAEELQTAQVKCIIPDDLRQNSHDLDIVVGGPADNILCEFSTGLTAYAIWVKLVALRPHLSLEDCRIEPIGTWIRLCCAEAGQGSIASGVL